MDRIECKKLKANIPIKTCISRQKRIKKDNGYQWGHQGHYEGENAFISCVGCTQYKKVVK